MEMEIEIQFEFEIESGPFSTPRKRRASQSVPANELLVSQVEGIVSTRKIWKFRYVV